MSASLRRTTAKNLAEERLATLERKLSTGEAELEEAVRTTRQLYQDQLRAKDSELEDHRRLLTQKEREKDGLRERFADASARLESRIHELLAERSERDVELRATNEALATARNDIAGLQAQLRATQATHTSEVEALANRFDAEKRELSTQLESIRLNMETEIGRLMGRLERVQDDKERLANELDTQMRKNTDALAAHNAEMEGVKDEYRSLLNEHGRVVQALKEEQLDRRAETERAQAAERETGIAVRALAKVRDDLKDEGEKRKVAVAKLKEAKRTMLDERTSKMLCRKLHAERKARRALETWLESELRSRGEMESLFGSLRDIALSRYDPSDGSTLSSARERAKLLEAVHRLEAQLETSEKARRVAQDDAVQAMVRKIREGGDLNSMSGGANGSATGGTSGNIGVSGTIMLHPKLGGGDASTYGRALGNNWTELRAELKSIRDMLVNRIG